MKRALFFFCVVLCGCEPGFRPETLIENLRLIGVSATPADLRPGEASQLKALVLDPSRAQPATVLWLGCAPDPYNQNRSACANPDVLNDPNALGGASGLPPGVSVIGFNEQASYDVPAGLFDVFAADDPRRRAGTVGQLIAFAVAETVSPAASREELEALFARVQSKEVKSIVALFRINIFEGDARNTNPVVDALTVHGEAWPAGAHVLVRPGEAVPFDLVAPDASFEPYVQTTPSGEEALNERILAAWYSTSGRFSETRTALREAVKTVFTAPGADEKDPVPARRTGELYTVLRDTRGGQSWRTWRFFVCDESLAEPGVTAVEWPVNAGEPVVLRGAALASVLDVVVDGVALERGAYSPTNDTWEGYLPAGSPIGNARGVLHAKTCSRGALVP